MKGSRPLTSQEITEIAQSFGGKFAKRDRALFILGVKSGFRITELLSLKIDDVLQGGKIVDRVTVTRAHMKKKIEGRTVLLHPEARAALKEWLAERQRTAPLQAQDYVFASRQGTHRPLSRAQAWRVLTHAYRVNELTGKLGTHAMRKTFANAVYQKFLERRADGEPIDPLRLTSKALGHKNLNSTDQYLSFLEQDIDAAILAL